MHHIVRRLILFPFMVIMTPFSYLIIWTMAGHDDAAHFVKEILEFIWNGDS